MDAEHGDHVGKAAMKEGCRCLRGPFARISLSVVLTGITKHGFSGRAKDPDCFAQLEGRFTGSKDIDETAQEAYLGSSEDMGARET